MAATAQPPRPHLSSDVMVHSFFSLRIFRPMSCRSHLVIFAENASTSQRRFPYPPRAPNKAFKAAIADQPRYLVSHKGKDERALHAEGPCHVPRLQFNRTEKTQEVFVHARQQPPTRSVSLLQRPPSLLSTNPNAAQANHFGRCGRSAPWLDGRTARTKGSVTLPF